jgi:hypothetical protein
MLNFSDGPGRSKYVAASAVLIGIGGTLGGLAGGLVAQNLEFLQSNPLGPFLWNNWHATFVISLLARVAAYHNVWWSMANEYDLMPQKAMTDWDRFFRIVQECDPCRHPRSIHNCRAFYDQGKPWVTHQSIQRADVEETRTWRDLNRKPVVVDECRYEGDIPCQWGCITAQEMVRRFWAAASSCRRRRLGSRASPSPISARRRWGRSKRRRKARRFGLR